VSWAPLRPVGRSRRAQARSGAFLEQWNLIVRYHQRNQSAAAIREHRSPTQCRYFSRKAGSVTDAEIVNPGVRTPAYPGHSDGHHSLRGHSRRHVDLARVASALCCG